MKPQGFVPAFLSVLLFFLDVLQLRRIYFLFCSSLSLSFLPSFSGLHDFLYQKFGDLEIND